MAVREFDAVDDRIVLGGTGLDTFGEGAHSAVMLIKPLSLPVNPEVNNFFTVGNTSPLAASSLYHLADIGGTFLSYGANRSDAHTGPPAPHTANAWQLLGWTVDASANIVFHRKVLGSGSWTHTSPQAYSFAEATINSDRVTLGSFNPGGTDSPCDMRVAMLAIFNSGLSNSQVESIETAASSAAVLALGPAGLWDLNQPSTAIAVQDLVGAVDQIAITGTTVVTSDDPAWTFLPLRQNDFGGGTDGVAISTGNSGGASGDAFNTVEVGTSGSLTYSNLQAGASGLSARAAFGATSQLKRMGWTGLGPFTGNVYARIYLYMLAATGGSINPQFIRYLASGGGQCATLGFYAVANGLFRWFNAANGSLGASEGTVLAPTNAWFRIETRCLPSTTVGEVEWRMWSTDSDSTGTPDDSGVATAAVLTADIGGVQFGPANTLPTNTDWWMRDFAVSADDWIGPAEAPPTPQILLPDGDIVTTGWSTAPLHSKLADESDATVITSTLA